MALEGKLERDRHDGLGAGASCVPGTTARYPAPGRANLEGGGKVQRALGARCVLTENKQYGKRIRQCLLVVQADMVPSLWMRYTYKRVDGNDAETGRQERGVVAEGCIYRCKNEL